MWAGIAGMWAW
jgi:hypothetical protein